MATEKFSNFASTVMVTALLNPGDTTLDVSPTTGALFPGLAAGEFFRFVMVDSLTAPTKREVIICQTHTGSSDTFSNLLRAQEGTVAQTWIAGNYVILRVTAGMLSTLQAVVPGSFEARLASTTDNAEGDALVGFRQANASGFLTSSVGTTVSRKFQDTYSQIDFGIVGDGVTDDATALNAAITVLNGLGVPCKLTMQGNCLINSAVTLKSNVLVDFQWARATWGGGATPMFTTATSGILNRAGVINGSFITNTASKLFELYSPYDCTFDNNTASMNSATSYFFDVGVNTAGATNAEGNRNAACNSMSFNQQTGSCGTFWRATGQSVSAVVTLNRMDSNQAASCSVYGIEHVQWSDNNAFPGQHRYGISAVNAIGVIENTGSPTTNVGVYSNTYGHIAVDALGGPFAGRVGLYLNNCSQFRMERLYQDPAAEGGQYVITQYAHGYDFNVDDAAAVGATQVTDNTISIYNAYNGAGNYMRLWIRYLADEALIYTDQAGTGVVHPLKFGVNGSVQWSINTSGNWVGDTGFHSILSTTGLRSWSTDLHLLREAANTLGQRNGTNAQLWKLYNTYTGATNYERLNIDWLTNDCIIYTSAGAGGGSTRALKFGVAGAAQWGINTSGHFVADTTNTYDIGASAGNKPRNGYFAGTLSFGTHSAIGVETVTGYITVTDAAGNSRKLAVVS